MKVHLSVGRGFFKCTFETQVYYIGTLSKNILNLVGSEIIKLISFLLISNKDQRGLKWAKEGQKGQQKELKKAYYPHAP